ncbi:regulatory protein, luxR family [Segatella bryantii]|uniref:response regulator transcription factor n=1 Tax=Segatella bryantii TaxID=77095 RepID=UPI00089B0603|nr:helix-turn-helix transcriptional regulator [Segatella bryantii]SEA06302.1 regulatory protein, luxR family [Segatella bryantii]
MIKKNDFFSAVNTVDNIPCNHEHIISSLINIIQSVARVSYHSVYLIDYFSKSFLYVSNNPIFLCGHSAEEVKELGFQFYSEHVPEEEQNMLVELNSNGFKFFDRHNNDKLKCYMLYNFHLQHGRKRILVNHKITPILLNNKGQIWIALCIVSHSAYKTPGHVQFHIEGSPRYWNYSFKTHNWEEQQGCTITNDEKDVLILSAEGLTTSEIADAMCKSLDSVKYYKRRVFEKLEVGSITEAIFRAAIHKLI